MRNLNIVEKELNDLKYYYHSLPWIARVFFPPEIARLLKPENNDLGDQLARLIPFDNLDARLDVRIDAQTYQDYLLYKKIKEKTNWFYGLFYSGLVRFLTNTQQTDKSITYLEQHGLLTSESLQLTADNFRSIVPPLDQDTMGAAKLLVLLNNASNRDDSKLYTQYGPERISAGEYLEKLAADLAQKGSDLGDANLHAIVNTVDQHKRRYDIAPALWLMNKAGLLQGESGLNNIKALGECERPYDILSILTLLSQNQQLSALTQSRFDIIIHSKRPYDINDCICALTINKGLLTLANLDQILNREECHSVMFDLRDALEVFAKTSIVSQANLDALFKNFRDHEICSRTFDYADRIKKLQQSGLLNGPEAQANFDRFNQISLVPYGEYKFSQQTGYELTMEGEQNKNEQIMARVSEIRSGVFYHSLVPSTEPGLVISDVCKQVSVQRTASP